MNFRTLLAFCVVAMSACGGEGPGNLDEVLDENSESDPELATTAQALGSSETDYYNCFQSGNCATPALSKSQYCLNGRDYDIISKDRKSAAIVVSFHGGLIEPNTDELTRAIADRFGWSHYEFSAHGTAKCLGARSNFQKLHITSTGFDEPKAVGLVSRHDKVLAIHGFSSSRGNNRGAICVGGRNTAQTIVG